MLKLIPTLLVAAVIGGGVLAGDAASAAPTAVVTARGVAAAPPVAWAAEDPADSLYREAREALNRGDYRDAARLFQRIVDRYPESAYAADAYYWRAFALYRAGGTSNLKAAQKALKAQKEKFPKAKTIADANELAVRVEGMLARQGDESSARRVTSAADSAARGTGCPGEDDESDTRVAALNALLQMDADRAMPILKQVLAKRDACSAGLRRKAMFLVSQKRTPETEEILLGAARTDPDVEVRKQAVFWLGQTRSERAVAALDSIMRRAGDEELRKQALFAIAQQHGERAARVLREVAEDTAQTQEMREQAVFWIGQQRSQENATLLREMFQRTRSDELREKILFSLSQMRGFGNDEWLLGIAADAKYPVDVRKQAIFSAGQNRVAVTALVALYDRLADAELKKQAIWVIADRREPAGIDKLIAIAKSDKDPEMRKTAIFWLGQSRDPRVQQLLLDIING